MTWTDLGGSFGSPKKKAKKKTKRKAKKKAKKKAKRKAKKKVAKKKARRAPAARARTPASVRRRRRSPAVRRGILGHVEPYWGAIAKACARSLGADPKSFLGPDVERNVLGTGYWGVVWRTADPRFVVKASLDVTEGPHIALAMKNLGKHPGLAYFHRLWQLPEDVFTNEQGYVPVWIMLREEVDVDSIYASDKKTPARGYKRIHDALQELPDCCSCLYAESGCGDTAELREARKEFDHLLRQVRRDKKGRYVADLIEKLYDLHSVLLGDVHYGNVGLRRHNLREFGVKFHRDLIVTDLGDLGQPPITRDQHPRIPRIRANPMIQRVPVLPC